MTCKREQTDAFATPRTAALRFATQRHAPRRTATHRCRTSPVTGWDDSGEPWVWLPPDDPYPLLDAEEDDGGE